MLNRTYAVSSLAIRNLCGLSYQAGVWIGWIGISITILALIFHCGQALRWLNSVIKSFVEWGSYMSFMAMPVQGANWGLNLARLALPFQCSSLTWVDGILSAASFAFSGKEMVVDHPVDKTWLWKWTGAAFTAATSTLVARRR